MVVLFLIFWETSVLVSSPLWWEVRGWEYREIWRRWPRTAEGSYTPCVSLTDVEGQWSSGGKLQLTCMGRESENHAAWRRVERLPIPNLTCDSYLYIFEILQCVGGVRVSGRQILPQGGISCLMVSELFLSGSRIKWQPSEGTVYVCGGKGCLNRVSSSPTANTTKALQLCSTLCDPMDCSLPGFSIHGILQARTLEWVAISFSNAWKWKVKVKSLSRSSL